MKDMALGPGYTGNLVHVNNTFGDATSDFPVYFSFSIFSVSLPYERKKNRNQKSVERHTLRMLLMFVM